MIDRNVVNGTKGLESWFEQILQLKLKSVAILVGGSPIFDHGRQGIICYRCSVFSLSLIKKSSLKTLVNL